MKTLLTKNQAMEYLATTATIDIRDMSKGMFNLLRAATRVKEKMVYKNNEFSFQNCESEKNIQLRCFKFIPKNSIAREKLLMSRSNTDWDAVWNDDLSEVKE